MNWLNAVFKYIKENFTSFADQMENFEHIYSLSDLPAIESVDDDEEENNE